MRNWDDSAKPTTGRNHADEMHVVDVNQCTMVHHTFCNMYTQSVSSFSKTLHTNF